MQYEVRLPDGKPTLMIHPGKRTPETIGYVVTGDYVTVEEVRGERARISHPMKGWVYMKNTTTEEQFLFTTGLRLSQVSSQNTGSDAVRNKHCMENISAIEAPIQTITSSAEVTSQNTGSDAIQKKNCTENISAMKGITSSAEVTSQNTGSDAIQKKYCMENISAIEARMQMITSSAKVSMDEKNSLSELQAFKRFFLELMWPEMEWMCHICTFLNTPQVGTCKICLSTRRKELHADMAVKLVKLLKNTKPVVEEKADSDRIDKLGKQVDFLSAGYGIVAKQVDDLEEINWQLSSRLVEVESTLSSCALETTNPKEWDVSIVCSWLERLGLGEYQEDFAEAMIDGESLLSCDAQKLEDLDIRRKHCPMILKGLEDLRKKWFGASNEVGEHKKQNVEPIVFTKETNMASFLEVKETIHDEIPVTMKQKEPIAAKLDVKPRGVAPDDKDEVCTSNVGKTTFMPKRESDGWQLC